MIKHIVMWKLKDYAADAQKAENARKLKFWLESLPKQISEIGFLEAGININDSEAAFDVVLYSEFHSKEHLKAYQAHPEHKRLIAEFLNKVRLSKTVVDYEV